MISCGSQQPAESGKYQVQCGVSFDIFTAWWDAERGIWLNSDGDQIIFGTRNVPSDAWIPKE